VKLFFSLNGVNTFIFFESYLDLFDKDKMKGRQVEVQALAYEI
jgi:hypothetical protein